MHADQAKRILDLVLAGYHGGSSRRRVLPQDQVARAVAKWSATYTLEHAEQASLLSKTLLAARILRHACRPCLVLASISAKTVEQLSRSPCQGVRRSTHGVDDAPGVARYRRRTRIPSAAMVKQTMAAPAFFRRKLHCKLRGLHSSLLSSSCRQR